MLNLHRTLLLFLLLSTNAHAQDFLMNLGPLQPKAKLNLQYATLESSSDKSKTLKTQEQNSQANLSFLLKKSQSTTLSAGFDHQEVNFSNERSMLDNYYSTSFNLNFRKNTEERNFWGLSLSYGSASNAPFKDNSDSTLSANYIKKFNQKWIGLVNYSNNRTFLNNIPIPTFMYIHTMTKDKVYMFGLPILFIKHPLSEKLSLSYFGFIQRQRLNISYKVNNILPYFQFEQLSDSYFEEGRVNKDERIFITSMRASLGIKYFLGRFHFIDFNLGRSFKRRIFSAENINEDKSSLVELEDATFAQINYQINVF